MRNYFKKPAVWRADKKRQTMKEQISQCKQTLPAGYTHCSSWSSCNTPIVLLPHISCICFKVVSLIIRIAAFLHIRVESLSPEDTNQASYLNT